MSAETLNASDYRFLSEMLEDEVGIHLEEGKEYLALTRLETVLSNHDVATLAHLVDRLRKNDRPLKADVIDAMTVNETLFFRDPNVWGSLRETLLPELIKQNEKGRTLRLWSAASSSGQEPYSLAIAISELLGVEDSSWHVKVDASDLSREMVERTTEAMYSNYEVSRGMEAETRDRYFNKRGEKWQVNERLRSRVSPRQANLANLPSDLGPYDLIMLRNVLIYFSADVREKVLREMSKLLAPDGYLLLGASEGALGLPDELTPVRLSGLVAFQATKDEPDEVETPDSSSDANAARDSDSPRARRSTDKLGASDASPSSRRDGDGHDSTDHHSRSHTKHSFLHFGGFGHWHGHKHGDHAESTDETSVPSETAASHTKPKRSGSSRASSSRADSSHAKPRHPAVHAERKHAASKPPDKGSSKAKPSAEGVDEPSAIDQLRALRDERENRRS